MTIREEEEEEEEEEKKGEKKKGKANKNTITFGVLLELCYHLMSGFKQVKNNAG